MLHFYVRYCTYHFCTKIDVTIKIDNSRNYYHKHICIKKKLSIVYLHIDDKSVKIASRRKSYLFPILSSNTYFQLHISISYAITCVSIYCVVFLVKVCFSNHSKLVIFMAVFRIYVYDTLQIN